MPKVRDMLYYRSLPYTRTVELHEEGGSTPVFVARIAEIPFIRIHGSTREEALFLLGETFEDCIQALIDQGEEIPEPELWPGRPVQCAPQISFMPSANPVRFAGATGPVVPLGDADPWTFVPEGAEPVTA